MIPARPPVRTDNEPNRVIKRAEMPIDIAAIESVSGMNARPVSIAS